jgi:Fic family protein
MTENKKMQLNKILESIDSVKMQIDNIRPLSDSILKQLKEYYRIGLTYSSNALEGNSLTESETKVVLEDGITIGGKPLIDVLETMGHSEAYDYMIDFAGKPDISENEIKRLHKYFYYHIDAKKAGVYRKERIIITGTTFIPPEYSKVPEEMSLYVKDFNNASKNMHPVAAAAFVHREFVRVHPFVDGNGRTARLLMNLVLFRNGYPITIIPPILRSEYINFLRIGQETGKNEKFDVFIAERVFESVREFKRLVL